MGVLLLFLMRIKITTEMPARYRPLKPSNFNVPGRWQRFTKRAFQSM
jgi:hypothetical protein